MQLQPHVGLVLSEDLDAVDMAEVGQQGHQVGAGVDDVADAVTGPHQQRHVRLLLALLGRRMGGERGRQRWDGEGLRFKEVEEVQDTVAVGEQQETRVSHQQHRLELPAAVEPQLAEVPQVVHLGLQGRQLQVGGGRGGGNSSTEH